MSREIDVTKAKKWSEQELVTNRKYLEDRGMTRELDQLNEVLGVDEGEEAASLTDGTIDDVLDKVGEDVSLVKAALDEEQAKDNPRKGLVDELEAIIEESEEGE